VALPGQRTGRKFRRNDMQRLPFAARDETAAVQNPGTRDGVVVLDAFGGPGGDATFYLRIVDTAFPGRKSQTNILRGQHRIILLCIRQYTIFFRLV